MGFDFETLPCGRDHSVENQRTYLAITKSTQRAKSLQDWSNSGICWVPIGESES